jgi:predicted permease
VLGRTLWLNGKSVSLLGVLPHGFIPPTGSSMDPDWAGLVVAYDPWSNIREGSGRVLVPFARLRPGATIEAARAEVVAVGRSAASAGQSLGIPAEWLRVDGIEQTLFARFRSHLWLIVLAAGFVLLIACANLASLLVVRGRSREQVTAVRAALGATRSRLAATAMIESLLVALGGSVVALMALAFASRALAAALPPVFARYAVGAGDPRVVIFSIGAAAVCAMVTGLAPVWKMRRLEFLALLRTGSRTGRETRARGGRGLLALEAALGAVLVLGSVLTLRSFAELTHDDLGFAPDGLYVLTASLPRNQQLERHRQVLDVLRNAPSIASIGGADHVPATSEAPVRGFKTERGSGARIQITSGYFETLQTPIAAGRTFTENEVAARAPVAMVSRMAAGLLFPDTRPETVIGRTWQAAGEPARLIVGVVDDLKNQYGDPRMQASVFLPAGTDPSQWVRFVLRARPGVTIAAHQIEEALRSRVGAVRVTLKYVPTALDPGLVDSRFRAVLFSALALTGLLLAAIGLYSVTSYEVATRRYEMGVRLMLGAAPRDLQQLTLRNACAPVILGATAGLFGAFWMAVLAKSFLYRVDGRDPVAYAVVAVVLVAAAVMAAWLPARRAARTDPAEVLRAQ